MLLRQLANNINNKLPPLIKKNLLHFYDALPEKVRFGSDIEYWNRFLRETESWDRKMLIDYQNEKLEEILQFATTHIPYYRSISDKIIKKNSLDYFPVLNKEDVKRKKDLLIPDNISPAPYVIEKTSGSTGTPLTFLIPQKLIPKERAFWKRLLRWGGYHNGDKILTIKGTLNLNDKHKPFASRFIKGDNHLVLSTDNLAEDYLDHFINTINEFKANVICGFPSVLYILSCHIKRKKLKVNYPKFIHTSSETLFSEVRAEIEMAFGCKILNWYGLNERCVTAQECPEFGNMHINMEYGYLEIKENGLDDGKGLILGTGFDNFAMPFIRYNTCDIGSISLDRCPCGRASLILKNLEGRIDDFVVTADGRYLPPSFFGVLMKHYSKVEQFQVIQERDTKIRLLIKGDDHLYQSDLLKIKETFEAHLKEPICIERVNEIHRTNQGKIRRVISAIGSALAPVTPKPK